jgi:hypothetical protein
MGDLALTLSFGSLWLRLSGVKLYYLRPLIWLFTTQTFIELYYFITAALPHHSNLAQIPQHARVDEVEARRRGGGVGRGGLARLGEALPERRLAAMERARQAIGRVLRKRRARQDEAPRSD